MKCFTVVVISILFWGGLLTNISKAQDDDCCPEEDKYGREDELLPMEWEKQMFTLNDRKVALLSQIDASNKDID